MCHGDRPRDAGGRHGPYGDGGRYHRHGRHVLGVISGHVLPPIPAGLALIGITPAGHWAPGPASRQGDHR
ncbi:hypothetical protein BJ982_006262 [Sphaerisporangium siamense]|uniref:Uncharacterized protein n=1 Tax=Sphaerisporangium siamense TaxID=795645 RepID=A0A7W7DG46_9ACTN|nr:hypothetical protein [Sphaerisporangium siamense]